MMLVQLLLIPAYGPEQTDAIIMGPLFSWVLFGPVLILLYIGHFIVFAMTVKDDNKKQTFDLKVIKGMAFGFSLWLLALLAISIIHINISYVITDIIRYLLMGSIFFLLDWILHLL